MELVRASLALAVLAGIVCYAEGLVLAGQHQRLNSSSDTDELGACTADRSLAKFKFRVNAITRAFEQSFPQGRIVLDDGSTMCLAKERSSEEGPVKQLSIVEKIEDEICRDNTDHHTNAPNRNFAAEKFQISGEIMPSLSDQRDFLTIWPPSGCTEDNPCPVVLFFHGCGGFLPYLQFAMYDDSCYNDLHSVLLFPKLINDMKDIEHSESWTSDGTEILENFVMPLYQNFVKQNAGIIDENRVTVMGESLCTGMAFQAGLLYPNIFSTIVATGITDGSNCEKVDDFHEKFVLPKKARKNSPEATKLKSVVATFAEKERNADERVKSIVDLITDSGVQDKVSVHFRVFPDMGHIDSILATQNQWSDLYKAVWQGSQDLQ